MSSTYPANRFYRICQPRPIMRAGSQRRLPNGSVTGFCWGGSTTIQYAAYDKKSAQPWLGMVLQGEYKDDPKPVSGFDVAKDITCPSSACSERRIKTRHRRMSANLKHS